MEICIDPRIELISVIQLLSNDAMITHSDFGYKRDVLVYFLAYQKHAAVTLFRKMNAAGFTFHFVPRAMLCLEQPPELQQKLILDKDVIESAGGEQQLQEFVALLRDFALLSNFMEFLDRYRSIFDMLIQNVFATANTDMLQLSDYFGMPIKDAVLILGMLLHKGGFGTSYKDGQRRYIHVLIGPVGSIDNLPVFGPDQFITEMIDHEFCHTVINPLTDAHATQVESLEHCYQLVAKRMQGQIGDRWSDCVNEHIIRAVTARMIALRYGEKPSNTLLHKHLAWGFVYVPRLLHALKRYEQQRDIYPTIAAFYPELLQAFDEK